MKNIILSNKEDKLWQVSIKALYPTSPPSTLTSILATKQSKGGRELFITNYIYMN